ncbi:MAG: hypothetical protein ACXWLZ_05475 [Rhizomicrobium sp.]
MNKHQLLAIAGAAAAIGLFSSVPANADVPPALVPGQVDGVWVTSPTSTTTLSFQQGDESHEAYASDSSFPTPDGFIGGIVFLTESGSQCAPDIEGGLLVSLGNCSDAFTMRNDTGDGQTDVAFISDGYGPSELALFNAAIDVTNKYFLLETGDWQDVSGDFGTGGLLRTYSQTWTYLNR